MEAILLQEFLPLANGEQWLFLTRIGKTPPAFGQTKRQVDPTTRRGGFQQNELAPSGQQFVDMAEGARQILRGMKHIGCDDDIVLVWGKSLLAGRLLNIELGVGNKWIISELLLGLTQEGCANVGESLLDPLDR